MKYQRNPLHWDFKYLRRARFDSEVRSSSRPSVLLQSVFPSVTPPLNHPAKLVTTLPDGVLLNSDNKYFAGPHYIKVRVHVQSYLSSIGRWLWIIKIARLMIEVWEKENKMIERYISKSEANLLSNFSDSYQPAKKVGDSIILFLFNGPVIMSSFQSSPYGVTLVILSCW